MKTFITFLLEYVIYEHKEWHQYIQQHGSKILDKMGHRDQYSGLQAEPGHGSPAHMTEYIKKHLGLSDVPKEHGKWILGGIQKGSIENLEDVSSTIIPNLQTFERTKNVHGANLKKVKGPTELFNLVSKHSQDDRDKRFNLTAGTDYHVLGENEHWTVIRPHTEKAACKFGKGTNWCTASESNSRFNEYTENGRPLHIFIPKAPKYDGEKYQLHPTQFMSHRNEPIHTVEGEGPDFHERPLPKETENNPDIEHGKILDALTSGNKKAAIEATNHPDFGSNDRHIDAAIRSPHKEVVIAGVNHPQFGSAYRHVRAALHSPHKEAAMAAVTHPHFGYNSNNDFTTAFKSPHSEVAMSAVNHPRFGSDIDHFNPALESPHKEVAKAAMNHPQFGSYPSHIYSALKSPHKEVAMAAINHPQFGSKKSSSLPNLYLEGALESPHKEVAMTAINHPDFGSGPNAHLHINAAVQSRHEEVAMAALNHPNYATILRGLGSGYHINAALRSPHKEVAMAGVNHPQFGFNHSHIDAALESPHEEVAMAAVNHPDFGSGNYGFGVSQIDDALRSPHPEVVEAAKRKQTPKT
jgi:hypothetical protein